MFAFAIWDETQGGFLLARDPYGIKPLYTANDGWTFRFASQVKALLAGNKVSRDPEPAGMVGFHLFGSVPEPFTLYREIRALPAGHVQWIDSAGPREPKPYTSISAILAEGSRNGAAPSQLDERVRAAVLDSVRAHLARGRGGRDFFIGWRRLRIASRVDARCRATAGARDHGGIRRIS